MALSYRVLGQSAPGAANTNLYTVKSGANCIISSILVCNSGASGATYQIAVVPNGQAVGGNTWIAYNAAVPTVDTMTLTPGITLGANDAIVVQANTTSVIFSVFGCEIS